MTNLFSKRSKHIFRYFKALGSPVRFLIIYKMLDGKPYTKNEILNYVSSLSGVPRTTVDRHFRTLLKYDIVRTTGKSLSSERGRKPLLYVLTVDSMMFYVSLFTYLLGGIIDKRLKLIEKSLSDAEALIEIVNEAKLKLYFTGDKIGNEVSINLSGVLDSCISLLSLIRETLRPKTIVTDCGDAIELLSRISMNQMILKKISLDKIRELMYVAYIESNISAEKLGFMLGVKNLTKFKEYDDLWVKIESSYGNDLAALFKSLISKTKCTDIESSYVISLANNLIKYFSNTLMNHDLVQVFLTI